MSARRNRSNTRSVRKRAGASSDFWGRPPANDDAAAPIMPSADPTAMISSLGVAPLPGRETIAEHYFATVYDKGAALATALAAAAGLLADPSQDVEDGEADGERDDGVNVSD